MKLSTGQVILIFCLEYGKRDRPDSLKFGLISGSCMFFISCQIVFTCWCFNLPLQILQNLFPPSQTDEYIFAELSMLRITRMYTGIIPTCARNWAARPHIISCNNPKRQTCIENITNLLSTEYPAQMWQEVNKLPYDVWSNSEYKNWRHGCTDWWINSGKWTSMASPVYPWSADPKMSNMIRRLQSRFWAMSAPYHYRHIIPNNARDVTQLISLRTTV